MRLGISMSIILFLGGIWVAIMPEIAGFQPAGGNPWTAPSLLAATLGGGIAVAALVGVIGFAARMLREREAMLLKLQAEREAKASRTEEAPSVGAPLEPVRALSDGREPGVRKLSRVERAQERAAVKPDPGDVNDAALKELAQTILQDLQKSPSH